MPNCANFIWPRWRRGSAGRIEAALSSFIHTMQNNPYAAPQSDVSITLERNDFKDIPTGKLKKLRNDSHSIRAVYALLFIGVVVSIIGVVVTFFSLFVSKGPEMAIPGLPIVLGCGVFYLVTLIGLMKRTAWGRVLGCILGGLALLAFPIGTLIGVLILVALGRSKELFGPDHLDHKSLEAEWKYRKKNKIA